MDVKDKSRDTLIDDFALWDENIILDEGTPWGDYQCYGKVYVPEGLKLRVSTTSSFDKSDNPIDKTLDGGGRQFQYLNQDDVADDNDLWEEEDRWVPLGTIEELNSDSDPTFDGRWNNAERGNNFVSDHACGQDLYEDP